MSAEVPDAKPVSFKDVFADELIDFRAHATPATRDENGAAHPASRRNLLRYLRALRV